MRGGPGAFRFEKRVSTLKSASLLYHFANADGMAAKRGGKEEEEEKEEEDVDQSQKR